GKRLHFFRTAIIPRPRREDQDPDGPIPSGLCYGRRTAAAASGSTLRLSSLSCAGSTGAGASVIRHWARCVLGNALTSRREPPPARGSTSRAMPRSITPLAGAPKEDA